MKNLKFTKPSPDALKRLAGRLCNLVDMGKGEKVDFEPRWRQNKANYDNVPIPCVSKFIPDAEDHAFPLVQPRIDALRDNIVGTICSQEPFMLAKLRGSSKRQEDLENTLQFFYNLGRLEDALKEASPIIGYTNTAILRVQFVAAVQDFMPDQVESLQRQKYGLFSFTGLTFDVIHPDDFVCVGSNVFGINNAQLTGHRFWQQRGQIREKVVAGKYYEHEELIASDGPDEDRHDRDVTNQASSFPGDDKIECWEVIFRCRPSEIKDPETYDPKSKDFDQYYKATIAVDSKVILCIEEYEASRPWYVALRWKPKDHDSFWCGRSVAQDLQALSAQYQYLNNTLIYGSLFAAFQPMVGSGQFEKNQKYAPGQMINLTGGELMPWRNEFESGAMPGMLTKIEDIADSVTGLNQAGMGQEYSKSSITATEVGQLASGQSKRIAGFISAMGTGLIDLADLCCEMLHLNYELWAMQYGDSLTVPPQEDFLKPIHWDLNGKNPDSTPEQTFMKMKMLLDLSQMEQQAGIQDVLASAQQILASMGAPPEIVEAFVNELMSAPAAPMLDDREIKRTMVYCLNVSNADKILIQEGDDDSAMGGTPAGPVLPGPNPTLAGAGGNANQIPADMGPEQASY